MEVIASQNQQGLREQLGKARERLDGLLETLQDVDRELDDLAPQRRQHELVHQACGALEELRGLDAAELFWGDRATGDTEEHLRLARARVDGFHKQVSEVEERRRAIVEDITQQEENTDVLEYDLFELQRREEERKLEWILEREISPLPARASVMPWAGTGEENARFRRSLAVSLLLSLLLALLLPLVDLPLPDPWEASEVPDRLTQLIQEERALPPPPPPREEPQLAENAPEPTDELVPSEQEAPEARAASKGILAFRENFSGLAANNPAARLGSQARLSRGGEADGGWAQRSLVTTQASGSSGGINLAAISRDVGGGGGQIEGVQVTRATSSIGGGTGQERPRSSGPPLGRTDEEIQIVFDRHKAALYRLYNRELRRDPTLKGQMVLRMRIEPDGHVSLCELQSTNMKALQLSTQVVARVQTFDFGAKDDISAVTILYPIDFLPAT